MPVVFLKRVCYQFHNIAMLTSVYTNSHAKYHRWESAHRHRELSHIIFLRRTDFGRWVHLKLVCGKHLVMWKVVCSIQLKSLLLVMSLSWLVISCQRLEWHMFISGKSEESVWVNWMLCFSSITLNQEIDDYKKKLRKCFWDNHFLQKGQRWHMHLQQNPSSCSSWQKELHSLASSVSA